MNNKQFLIKFNDNTYLIQDELPEFGELSVWINSDKTIVSGVRDQESGCTEHVKVIWTHEKIPMASKSSYAYITFNLNNERTSRMYVNTTIKIESPLNVLNGTLEHHADLATEWLKVLSKFNNDTDNEN